ncbi:MAG: hypothetical protein IT426_13345 [Pirellulales bacterium]|nr:hypothetical protein [Pirellulales bacterium]
MKRLYSSAARYGLLAAVASLFLVSPGLSAETKKKSAAADPATANLIRTALQHELAGQNDRRASLLLAALERSPDDPAVHWQLGEVRGEGKNQWLSPAQVELAAGKDARLAEYRRRRDAAGPALPEQVALAQWCRKNKLADEERVHWLSVLQMQPNYPEAVERLDLRNYRGRMLTAEQIARFKEQSKNTADAIAQWRPLVTHWQRALDRGETATPAEIGERIARISDSGEMLALQRAIVQKADTNKQKLHELTVAFVQALRDNPHPAAAESLARLAVFSAWDDVRKASAAGLKGRPLDHFAPLLLAALQLPIEGHVRFDVDGNGNLITFAQLYREGDLADYTFSYLQAPKAAKYVYHRDRIQDPNSTNSNFYGDDRDIPGNLAAWQKTQTPAQTAFQRANPQRIAQWQRNEKARNAGAKAAIQAQQAHPLMDGLRMEAERQANAAKSRAIAANKADALYDEMQNSNRAIEQSNARVVGILKETTGQDLGDRPLEWWKWWWNRYNETDALVDAEDRLSEADPYRQGYEPAASKYVVPFETVRRYDGYHPIPTAAMPATPFTASAPPTTITVRSCFAPGTKVWTHLGRLPIEKIKVGDRVLSQNPDTGELCYKPVLEVTFRPPLERLKIGLGTDSFIATPGHPFWVDGKAWQLAKQLEVGQILHAVSGGAPVESIEKVETDPSSAGYSYNLVVADFNTYFVGKQGILVHDNTPRWPTSALIPGLPAEARAP